MAPGRRKLAAHAPSLTALSRTLDRHPRTRAVVHRAADRALKSVARVGLDLNALRIRPEDSSPQAALIHRTPLRPAQLVKVRQPQARFDLEPAGFHAMTERISRGYSRPADSLLELSGGRFDLPSGFLSVGGRLPSEAIPLLYFPHGYTVLPALRSLYARATPVPDGILIHLPLAWSYYHWLCEVFPRAMIAA